MNNRTIIVEESNSKAIQKLQLKDIKRGDHFQYRLAKSQGWNPDVFVATSNLNDGKLDAIYFQSGHNALFLSAHNDVSYRVFDTITVSNPRENVIEV